MFWLDFRLARHRVYTVYVLPYIFVKSRIYMVGFLLYKGSVSFVQFIHHVYKLYMLCWVLGGAACIFR